MPSKPFHHGALRDELLSRARATLRASGQDGLSLRQLAREAGVSHGAPRRHFPERQDLLDALAEQGFDDLTAGVVGHVGAGRDEAATFHAIARAYIDFAVQDAELMDLMFSMKGNAGSERLMRAADRFFSTVGSLLSTTLSAPASGIDSAQVQLLLACLLHGIAALVTAGRLDVVRVDSLVDDAGTLFGVRPSDAK